MANDNVHIVREDTIGQGGALVPVHETFYQTDRVILDVNDPLAVQIPQGVGADGSRTSLELANQLAEGHVEAKFGTSAAPLPSVVDGSDAGDHGRAIGDDSGTEHVADHDFIVTPEVFNKPAAVVENEQAEVVEDHVDEPVVEAPAPAEGQQPDPAAAE